LRTAAIIELVTGAGLLLFWAGFFTIGLAPANPPECYLAYEHSFWLPDIILAIALITAAVRLRKDKAPGRSLSLICAGALIFLGVLDFSFNIQNGVYTSSTLDLILNAFINAWCVVAGMYLSVRLG
jgi:hypothetical protein